MGVKSKRGKSFNAKTICGDGSRNDAKRSRTAFDNTPAKIGHNTFCWNGSKQKVLRSRNNVDPNNRQQKYYTPNQDT